MDLPEGRSHILGFSYDGRRVTIQADLGSGATPLSQSKVSLVTYITYLKSKWMPRGRATKKNSNY